MMHTIIGSSILLFVVCFLIYSFLKSHKEFEDRKKKYLEIRDKIIAGFYKKCDSNVLKSDIQGFSGLDKLALIDMWSYKIEIDEELNFDPDQRPQKIQVSNRTRDQRVESGSVEFTYKDGETDWSGFFLRGDNFMNLTMQMLSLEEALKNKNFEHADFCFKIIKGILTDESVFDKNTPIASILNKNPE